MDLHQIRCANAVARYGSFTRAAAAMHLTQPSLSYVVAKLEAELGARLFARLPREVVLTPAGQAFLDSARVALEHVERARTAVKETADQVAGHITMICVRTAATQIADTFSRFHRRYPKAVLALCEPEEDLSVVEALRTGRCELGVMRASMVPPDLMTINFGLEEWVVALPYEEEFPVKDLTIAELALRQLVAPAAGTPQRSRFDDFFATKSVSPEIVAECSNLLVTLELVRAGVCAALIPRALAGWVERSGVAIRFLDRPEEHLLVLAHRPGELSPAAAAYRAMLVEQQPVSVVPTPNEEGS